MTYLQHLMLELGVVLALVLSTTSGFAGGDIVTVVFPTGSANGAQSAPGPLKISAGESDPITPIDTVHLTFDLSLIPKTATIKKATVQFTGQSATTPDNPQLVKIFPHGSTESVASWTATSDKSVFHASTEPLRALVEDALKTGTTLALTFSSKSRLSDWRYASMSAYDGISRSKPRLIVEYQPPRDLQDRARDSDTTRTRWKFSGRQQAASKPFLDTMTDIISNPVFYDDVMYVFAKPSSEKTHLYALKLGGGNRWEPKALSHVPGSHALISPAGRLYSIGEQRLVLYDLTQEGQEIRAVSIPNFKPAVRPTLGEDGSLYAMPPGALFGFNPDLQEMWRYPGGDTEMPDASRVALSPDAGRYAYALTKSKAAKTQLVRMETATGNSEVSALPVVNATEGGATSTLNLDLGFTGYTRPIVAKGPEHEYVLYSASTAQSGLLLAHSGGEAIWWKQGLISQPILNSDQNVVAVQGGKLHVYALLNGKDDGTEAEQPKSCASKIETSLSATSNLVLDGEDNVYFWNNGVLWGFTKQCTSFLHHSLAGLPEKLELLFAPDGTLFARTETNQLYALRLLPENAAVTLTQHALQTDTIYHSDSLTTEPNLQVASKTNVVFKAKDQMTFGRGFSVKSGATLRCQVGW